MLEYVYRLEKTIKFFLRIWRITLKLLVYPVLNLINQNSCKHLFPVRLHIVHAVECNDF